MRYRKLSSSGDYVFGNGGLDYLVNSPETVGQAVLTRLRLRLGEWFMNTSDGTAWQTQILGHHTEGSRDLTIQDRVLGTVNLTRIVEYASQFDPLTRTYKVQMTVDTAYGETTVNQTLSGT